LVGVTNPRDFSPAFRYGGRSASQILILDWQIAYRMPVAARIAFAAAAHHLVVVEVVLRDVPVPACR